MSHFLKKMTVPYHLSHWYTNLIAALPQIIGGFILLFFCLPKKIGLPWSRNGLATFEISEDFVSTISGLGGMFSVNKVEFAYLFVIIGLLAGFILILGLFTRFFSFIFLIPLIILSVFREFDGTWSYIPYFCYISICIMALVFGSGRFGIDYLIAKKMRWV